MKKIRKIFVPVLLVIFIGSISCNNSSETSQKPEPASQEEKGNKKEETPSPTTTPEPGPVTDTSENNKLLVVMPDPYPITDDMMGLVIAETFSNEFKKNNAIKVLQLPIKRFYQLNVYGIYSKKYLGEIIKVTQPRLIFMSKCVLDQSTATLNYVVETKVYDVKKDRELILYSGQNSKISEINKEMKEKAKGVNNKINEWLTK